MTSVDLITVDVRTHRAELIEMNVEYLFWVFHEVEQAFGFAPGIPANEYASSILDEICGNSSVGNFYFIVVDGMLAGMGGLRGLVVPRVAEIKRIYVRPAFRGRKLGERLLQRLLSDARDFGYERVYLDSAPFMESAQQLYEQCGFRDCPPYQGSEVPAEFHAHWRFMMLVL